MIRAGRVAPVLVVLGGTLGIGCGAPPAPIERPEPVASSVEALGTCSALPPGVPATHAPVPMLWTGYSAFQTWARHGVGDDDVGGGNETYPEFRARLVQDGIRTFGRGAVAAEHPFTTALGPIRGHPPEESIATNGVMLPKAIYGDLAAQPDDVYGAGLPTPAELSARITAHQQYTQDLAGVAKPHGYLEFGTALYGRRALDPHDPNAGFWHFYTDHWNDYDGISPIQMGTRPGALDDWLLRGADPTQPGTPYPPPTADLIAETAGFQFEHAPWKPTDYGHQIRWAVNILSPGWQTYWPMAMRWDALAGFTMEYIDNVGFRDCYNTECEAGYLAYLEGKFTPAEAHRLFTTGTSYLANHSFEESVRDAQTGEWRLSSITPVSGRITADEDSYLGLYSMRLDDAVAINDGGAIEPASLLHLPYRFTVHYKVQPGSELKVEVTAVWNSAPVGPLTFPCFDHGTATVWTEVTCEIPAFAEATVPVLKPTFTSIGRAWVDEVWVTELQGPPGQQVTSHPRFALQEARGFGGNFNYPNAGLETTNYWNSLVGPQVGLLRSAAREYQPGFEIYANSGAIQYANVDYYKVEAKTLEPEAYRADISFPPGRYLAGGHHQAPIPPTNASPVLQSELLITNIFDYEYINALRRTDQFAYPSYQLRTPDPDYEATPDSMFLQLAETAAFGGGAGGDLQYDIQPHSPELRVALRVGQRKLFDFTNAHASLYECKRSVADVGVMVEAQDADGQLQAIDVAKSLEAHNILYDVLTEARMDLANLQRHRAVILQAVNRVSTAEAAALLAFVDDGGLLVIGGSVPQFDELNRLWLARHQQTWNLWWLPSNATTVIQQGAGTIVYQPGPIADAGALVQQYLGSLGTFPMTPPNLAQNLRAKVWTDDTNEIVHLLSYDVVLGPKPVPPPPATNPYTNVLVRVPRSTSSVPNRALLFSPDGGGFLNVVTVTPGPGSTVEFMVPELRSYTVAQLFHVIDDHIQVPVLCSVPGCMLELRPWLWQVNPPWSSNLLDQLPGPAQTLALGDQYLAAFRDRTALDVGSVLSDTMKRVLASNAVYLSPAEPESTLAARGLTTQAVAIPQDLAASGALYEVVTTRSGLDAVPAGVAGRSRSGTAGPTPRTGARAVFAGTLRSVFVAGGATTRGPTRELWGYDVARQEWTLKLASTSGLGDVLGITYDASSGKLVVADQITLTTGANVVRLSTIDPVRSAIVEVGRVPAARTRGKLALNASARGGFVVLTGAATGGWEAWSFTIDRGRATWRTHGRGAETMLDDPVPSDRGLLAPLGRSTGLAYTAIEDLLTASTTAPAAL